MNQTRPAVGSTVSVQTSPATKYTGEVTRHPLNSPSLFWLKVKYVNDQPIRPGTYEQDVICSVCDLTK